MPALRNTPVNRQVILVSRPDGVPGAEHFAVRHGQIAAPLPGQVVIRNEWLSVDPAMRGWVSSVPNYSEPVPVGGVMRSFAVGVVEESRSTEFRVGDRVTGLLGWQEFATVDPGAISRRVDEHDLPASLALGVLGLTGTTAWFAMTEIGRPRPGDTVVVSTAAGAVGSVAGQLAKLAGCRTVGIAGGAQKVAICLDEFGYDAAVDYRSPTFAQDLAAACPSGVDVYFDNTSGPVSDAVFPLLARRARVIVCGTSAIDSWDPWPQGPLLSRHLLNKSARAEGFLYFDYAHRLEEAVAKLAPLVREGSIRYREDVLQGLGSAPGAIARLYRGQNLGKQVISLQPAAGTGQERA